MPPQEPLSPWQRAITWIGAVFLTIMICWPILKFSLAVAIGP